jgi:hypothetical protein
MDKDYNPSTSTGALVKAMVLAGLKSAPRPMDEARWWVRGNPRVVSWPKGERVPAHLWALIPPAAREKVPAHQWPLAGQEPSEG